MNSGCKFLSIFLIFTLLSTVGAAEIIKEIPTKPDLDNFTTTIQKGPGFVDRIHSEAIEQLPTMPHDKWIDPKTGKNYESLYSLNNSSKYGYDSFYFDDNGTKLPSKCFLVLKLVEPYYGLNVSENCTEENNTVELDPLLNDICENNSTVQPEEEVTPSEINFSMKNGTSGDSVAFISKVSKPTEQKKSWFLEMCSDAWSYVFGGN